MCGIIGTNFISNKFEKSLQLLNNRGPDFQKAIKIDDKEFGHTRLAIIDLNEEAIAAGIQQLLDNKEIREKLKNKLKGA